MIASLCAFFGEVRGSTTGTGDSMGYAAIEADHGGVVTGAGSVVGAVFFVEVVPIVLC
jgi:hypothetical protein